MDYNEMIRQLGSYVGPGAGGTMPQVQALFQRMAQGRGAPWAQQYRPQQQAPSPMASQAAPQDGLTPAAEPGAGNGFPNIMSQQEAMGRFQSNPQWNAQATPGMVPGWSSGVGVPTGMDRGYLPAQMQGLFKGKKGK